MGQSMRYLDTALNRVGASRSPSQNRPIFLDKVRFTPDIPEAESIRAPPYHGPQLWALRPEGRLSHRAKAQELMWISTGTPLTRTIVLDWESRIFHRSAGIAGEASPPKRRRGLTIGICESIDAIWGGTYGGGDERGASIWAMILSTYSPVFATGEQVRITQRIARAPPNGVLITS